MDKLSDKDAQEASWASHRLRALPVEDVVPATRALIKAMSSGDATKDAAASVLILFGPEHAEALPAILAAVKEEKDPKRRQLLVELIGMLGVSGRSALPVVKNLAASDPDEGVRTSAKTVVDAIDVTDAKIAEMLVLLKLRKYESRDQREEVHDAVLWVIEHRGLSVELIRELMRLELDERLIPDLENPGSLEFFRNSPWASRIGIPVLEDAITGKDEPRRAAALDLLYELAEVAFHWPAELALERLLGSINDAAVKATISRIPRLSKANQWVWLRGSLGRIANTYPDASIKKSAEVARLLLNNNPEGG